MISIIRNKSKKNTKNAVDIISKVNKSTPFDHYFINDYPILKKKSIDIIKKSDAIVVIGGDGTILSTLSSSQCYNIPVLAVNSGHLGFIAIHMNDFEELFTNLLIYLKTKEKGHVFFDNRNLLEVTLHNKVHYVLNECVILKYNPKKLLQLDCSFNGKQIISGRADGVIISTATGSTAYNLAASGPILNPHIPAFIFNPICPHSLTMKPVVIPGEDELSIFSYLYKDSERRDAFVIFDGCTEIRVSGRDEIKFNLSNKSVHFIKPLGDSYYQTLQKKLLWGK